MEIQKNQEITLVGFQKAASETLSIVRQSLSIDEREIIESFTGDETIGTLISKKHPNLSNLFRQAYLTWMVLSGIRSKKDEPETSLIDPITEKFLVEYIKKNYQNYTFAEIEKAFYFHSIGKLAHRHEHFQLFDTNFVSKVLEDWLILKSKTRQRAASLLPPVTEKPISDEESYNGLLQYVQKNNEFPKFWSWSKVYNHMDECLMIEETNETKKELYDSVYHRLKNKLDLDILDMKNASDRKERQESLPNDVKIECRRIMVQKYLRP